MPEDKKKPPQKLTPTVEVEGVGTLPIDLKKTEAPAQAPDAKKAPAAEAKSRKKLIRPPLFRNRRRNPRPLPYRNQNPKQLNRTQPARRRNYRSHPQSRYLREKTQKAPRASASRRCLPTGWKRPASQT